MTGEVAGLSWRRWRLSGSAAHVSALTVAAVTSQVVQLGASVLLARLYSPTQFGVFAVCMSVANIAATVATLQYQVAIPLAPSDDEARDLTWLSIVVALGLVVAASSLALAGMVAVGDSDSFELGGSLWIAPVLTLLLALWGTLRSLQSRYGAFAQISKATVIGTTTQVAGQLLAAVAGLTAVGLTLGYSIGRAANALAMFSPSGLGRFPGWPRLVAASRKWREMPIWLLIPTVLNIASITAVAGVVSLWYGVTVAGYFSLALSVMAMPAALFGQAVSTVVYPRAAALHRDGASVVPMLNRVITALGLVGVPFFGLLMVAGPELFSVVFGRDWEQAGQIAALLAPWLLVGLVSSAVSGLALVKERQRTIFVVAIVEATLRFGGLALGGAVDNYLLGIGLYSLAGCIITLLSLAWFMRLAGGRLSDWARPHGAYLAMLVGAYIFLLLTDGRLPGWLWWAAVLSVTVGTGLVATRHLLGLLASPDSQPIGSSESG